MGDADMSEKISLGHVKIEKFMRYSSENVSWQLDI